MSHFLALSGSRTKFNKSAFLFQFIASLLKSESADLDVLHATDIVDSDDNGLFRWSARVLSASGIILLTPVNKNMSPDLLLSVLARLPDNTFSDKAVALYATGGFVRDAIATEEMLRPELRRLGVNGLSSFIHLDSRSWIILGERKPQLSRSATRRITQALDEMPRDVLSRGIL
jgi:NAD(P)H-dependent FMN reductase